MHASPHSNLNNYSSVEDSSSIDHAAASTDSFGIVSQQRMKTTNITTNLAQDNASHNPGANADIDGSGNSTAQHITKAHAH
jgi:hypothetical protein